MHLRTFTILAIAALGLGLALISGVLGSGEPREGIERLEVGTPHRSSAIPDDPQGVGDGVQKLAPAAGRSEVAPGREVRIRMMWWPRIEPEPELPHGTIKVVRQASGPHGRVVAELPVERGVAVLRTPSRGPSSWLVAQQSFADAPAFLLDTAFAVSDLSSDVELRIAREPFIVAVDSTSLEELAAVWVAEGANPPRGAYPRWKHPGPWELDFKPELVSAPVPAKLLSGSGREMLGAPGRAWAPVPRTLIERGGTLFLGRGGSVALDLCFLKRPGRLERLDLVLSRIGAPPGEYDFGFQVGGGSDPLPDLSADSRLSLRIEGILPGEYHLHAMAACARRELAARPRTFEGRTELRVSAGALTQGSLVLDGRPVAVQVEGWVVLPEPSAMESLHSLRLERRDALITEILVDGPPMRKGVQLVQEGADTLHWAPASFSPGAYLAILEPLGIYVPFVVPPEPDAQSLLLEVPTFQERRHYIRHSRTGELASLESVAWELSIGDGAFRAPQVRMAQNRRERPENPIRISAPRGARLRLMASASGGLQGDWLLDHDTTEPVELSIDSSPRPLTLSVYSFGAPVEMPSDWWLGGIRAVTADGRASPVRVQLPPAGPSSFASSAKTHWGWIRESDAAAHEVTLYLPEDARELTLPPAAPGETPSSIELPADWPGTGIEAELGRSPLAREAPSGAGGPGR